MVSHGDMTALKYQSPDAVSKPDPKQCSKTNRDLMRAIIDKKMKKNATFFELKVLSNSHHEE
jgi:hypothetical protein